LAGAFLATAFFLAGAFLAAVFRLAMMMSFLVMRPVTACSDRLGTGSYQTSPVRATADLHGGPRKRWEPFKCGQKH
jgi:hypothetical protein